MAKEYKPRINIMDNQAMKHIEQFLTKNKCTLQLVEPHIHQVNTAELAIQTFKDSFITVSAMTDSHFSLQLWDTLMLPVMNTLNIMFCSHKFTPQYLEALNAHMIGMDSPLLHLDAKQSFMRMETSVACGHLGGSTGGTLVPQWIIIGAICIYPQHQGIPHFWLQRIVPPALSITRSDSAPTFLCTHQQTEQT
jgi:hypothetical protein